MAITMMCEPGTPGAVLSKEWSKPGNEIWVVTTHVGLVIGLREMNGYDDSDFYATTWNAEKGAPEEVLYASTRGWTYPNGAAVDATAEVRAAYDAFRVARLAEARARREAAEAAAPAKGKKARIARNVKGKNAIEAGVEGVIFWVGADKFARSYYGAAPKLRVGFEAADGRKVFVAENAVEVIAA